MKSPNEHSKKRHKKLSQTTHKSAKTRNFLRPVRFSIHFIKVLGVKHLRLASNHQLTHGFIRIIKPIVTKTH